MYRCLLAIMTRITHIVVLCAIFIICLDSTLNCLCTPPLFKALSRSTTGKIGGDPGESPTWACIACSIWDSSAFSFEWRSSAVDCRAASACCDADSAACRLLLCLS